MGIAWSSNPKPIDEDIVDSTVEKTQAEVITPARLEETAKDADVKKPTPIGHELGRPEKMKAFKSDYPDLPDEIDPAPDIFSITDYGKPFFFFGGDDHPPYETANKHAQEEEARQQVLLDINFEAMGASLLVQFDW